MFDTLDLAAEREGSAIIALRASSDYRPNRKSKIRVNYFSDSPRIVKRGNKMAGRNKVNPNETLVERFKRLGNVRLGKAVRAIGLMAHLTGNQYVKTPEQVNIIEKALQDGVKDAVASLRLGRGSAPAKSWL